MTSGNVERWCTARPGLHHACWLVVSGLLLAAGGCGGGEPSAVPVEGVITLDGQTEWPAAGTLFFYPTKTAEGFPSNPGTAEFDQQGRFVAETHQPGDGLMPGEYQVHLRVWKKRPTMTDPAGVSLVPERYRKRGTSGLTVSVPEEGNRNVTLNVEST